MIKNYCLTLLSYNKQSRKLVNFIKIKIHPQYILFLHKMPINFKILYLVYCKLLKYLKIEKRVFWPINIYYNVEFKKYIQFFHKSCQENSIINLYKCIF